MFRCLSRLAPVMLMLTTVTAVAQDDTESEDLRRASALPSAETIRAIEALPTEIPDGRTAADILESGSLVVNRDELPATSSEFYTFDASGNALAPFTVPNSVVLVLDPNIGEDVNELVANYNLAIIDKYPNLSSVRVEADLTRFFVPQPADNSNNDALIRGLLDASNYYKSLDPGIVGAIPEPILSDQAVTNLVEPSNRSAQAVPGQEDVDWGIQNIEADQLWDRPGAADGVVLGVLDTGFARHEDITFLRVPATINSSDHGNHVSGIICGEHGNGRGMKGVLPRCFVRPQVDDRLNFRSEGGDTVRFIIGFGDILTSFDRLTNEESSVKVFNVSLGYNWMSNFGINPDGANASLWRDYVRMQGPIVLRILARAEQTRQVIFSAAGNDSSTTRLISAEFASPMNWGARYARENNLPGGGYGVIVEAHDRSGERAEFSNVNGDISCPGVDIRSAVAFDANDNPSESWYGEMSGTSMASPYCAGGYALISLVRPDLEPIEILDCMLQSSRRSSSGAPMLKLQEALVACQ